MTPHSPPTTHHSPMITPLIVIEHVTKRFPGVVALNDVTFDIQAGELHAVVGENGAGKSTLMKILSGVITDYEGQLGYADSRCCFRALATPKKPESASFTRS